MTDDNRSPEPDAESVDVELRASVAARQVEIDARFAALEARLAALEKKHPRRRPVLRCVDGGNPS